MTFRQDENLKFSDLWNVKNNSWNGLRKKTKSIENKSLNGWMIKKTVNIRLKWKDIEKKPTHKVDIIGALCLKQLHKKHDFPAFNGFICDECRSSWIERNICTPWWNDCCKKQHQRQWQNSNIPNLLKPQLKLRTTYESRFRHL